MPASSRRPIAGLYVIIDPAACRHDAIETARAALDGGACLLQWRDKLRDKGDQLGDLLKLHRLCREFDVPLIVNDHADLAAAVRAEGLHLGQHDLPIEYARAILGAAAIIGVSTNNVEEAKRAEAEGADYIAVGAMFATRSKDATRPAGLDRLREIRAAVRTPIVAIGGIDATNIQSVVAAGAHAAAVISAVCAADDPRAAARELAAAFTPHT